MTEDERGATIVIDQGDAEEEEYPTCWRDGCDSPLVYFVHTNAIGYTEICSNPDCEDGLENFCKRQVSMSLIKKCIDNTGIDTLRKLLQAKLISLNEYREENDLTPVDIPDTPTAET